MISVGQKPDLSFVVSAVVHGEEKTLPFAALISKPTVVSVHFKNSSSSCDKQHDSLLQFEKEIGAFGYQIVTLSQDSCATSKKYAVKKSIGYTLVSDIDMKFAAATDSMVEKNMYGKTYIAPARIAVIFDATGTVQEVLVDVTAKEFGKEIVSRLTSLTS